MKMSMNEGMRPMQKMVLYMGNIDAILPRGHIYVTSANLSEFLTPSPTACVKQLIHSVKF